MECALITVLLDLDVEVGGNELFGNTGVKFLSKPDVFCVINVFVIFTFIVELDLHDYFGPQRLGAG